MSAPLTKSQMAFELPKLTYIDTRWEEPAVRPASEPGREPRFGVWLARGIATFHSWRARVRERAELSAMTDRELFDVGLNRGDFDRIFIERSNEDLRARGSRYW